MKNRKIWTKESYENYPVIVDANRELYCDQKILEEIKRQFDYAEKNKKRIFFMRYDIRLPVKLKAPCNNKLICDFQANFVKNLQRHGLKPQYLLVREQSREKHQHYHGVLFLDELSEFSKTTLEILRQPMEEQEIHLSRASGNVVYPASFLLLASMNERTTKMIQA